MNIVSLRHPFAWFVLAIPVLFAGFAVADTAPERPPAVQDLRQDWWDYFKNSPSEELPARISAFEAALDRVVDEARDRITDAAEITSRPKDIKLLLSRYQNVRQRKTPPPPALNIVKDSYTFNEFLEQLALKRERLLQQSLDSDQIQLEDKALSEASQNLRNEKAAYLGLRKDDPRRLTAGLELIKHRLTLAIATQNLAARRARLTALMASVDSGDLELTAAVERLQISEAQITKTNARAEKAASEAAALRTKLVMLRAAREDTDDSAAGLARERVQAQEAIALEVEIANAETLKLRYRLQAEFLKAKQGAGKGVADPLRDARHQAETFIANTRKSLEPWRKAVSRERIGAMESLSNDVFETPEVKLLAERRLKLEDKTSRDLAQLDREIDVLSAIERLAADLLLAQGGRLQDIEAGAKAALESGWDMIRKLATASLFEINETPVTLLGLLRVAIILVTAWWLSKAVRHGITQLMDRQGTMSRSSLYTLGRVMHYAILVVAFLIALSSIGLDFTKLALVVSALGVGIGFGLQAIVSNFISGLIILFEKSLKVGDFVELESGVTGEVHEINIRSTVITTNDNVDILVPNSEFVNGRVTNWTLRDAYRRVHVPLGVAYGTDKELVKQACLEAANEVPFTLRNFPGREPRVWLVEFGDSSLNFELVVWLKQDAVSRPSAVHAAYTWAIETALAKHGIEIPFPQRDLHVRSFLSEKDGSSAVQRLESARQERGETATDGET